MLALFNNDFYEFYHNAEIDFSSPLKRKKFEQSQDYAEWKDEMQMQRDFVIGDTLHMPLEGIYREPIQYDVNRGGFIISPYHPSVAGNSKFLIPTKLTKFFDNPRISFAIYQMKTLLWNWKILIGMNRISTIFWFDLDI